MFNPPSILENQVRFLYYKRDYLKLSTRFTAYDASGAVISKEMFYKTFAGGGYLPLRLKTGDSSNAYTLYHIPDSISNDVRTLVSRTGKGFYEDYKREGTPFPFVGFTDINGRVYDSLNTRGKILVLKFWFIHCVPCVQEMPELNVLVEKYQDRKDVLFLSFAFDPREKLVDFMQKTRFKYAVLPVSEQFINNDAGVGGYPTHMVLDRAGIIYKILPDKTELEDVIAELLAAPPGPAGKG